MTLLPSTTGEVAVPNSGGAGGAFLRHSSLPVARSCAEKMPLMPSVKTRPSAIAGVDFGPGPWPVAAGVHGVGRIDAVLPELLARLQVVGRDDFAIAPGASARRRGCPRRRARHAPVRPCACQRLVSCAGQAAGTVNDEATPSRAGPRHCDHSTPAPAPAIVRSTDATQWQTTRQHCVRYTLHCGSTEVPPSWHHSLGLDRLNDRRCRRQPHGEQRRHHAGERPPPPAARTGCPCGTACARSCSAGHTATIAQAAPSSVPPTTSASPSDSTMPRMLAGVKPDRAQQPDVAPAFEHVAREHRAQADRAEQQAERAQRLERRQVGVLHLVIRRPALERVADVEAVVRQRSSR